MSCQSPDHKRVKLDPEELETKAKAASIAKCGDESEWELHLLAEVAIAMKVSEVAVSLKAIPADEPTTDGQSGAGPSASKETREAGEPEAIAKTQSKREERKIIESPGLGSDWHSYLELSLRNSSLEPEAEDNHSKKRGNTLGSPEPVPKSLSVSPGSRKRPHSAASAEETDNDDEDDEDEDEETGDGEGETDCDCDDAEGVQSSAAPLPSGTAGGSNRGVPHEKTIAAHGKAAAILGPGKGPHPRGRCVKCIKGGHQCIVNPNVGNGNTCYRCAKNKEKCSHQEYLDGRWIRENGNPAPRPCTQCVNKASQGLPAECYQVEKKAHDDKYGKACSRCHMDGTKNACSLKQPRKQRPPKGQAPKKQKK